MTTPDDVTQLDQRRLVRVVRRHLGLMLVFVLLGLAAGAAFVGVRGLQYTATSQLLVGDPPSLQSLLSANPTPRTEDKLLDSQLRRLESDRIQGLVQERLGADVPAYDVSFTSSTDTNVVSVVVTSRHGRTARDVANAYPAVYLDDLTRESGDLVARTEKQLQQGIDSLTKQITSLENSLSSASPDSLAQVQAVVGPSRDDLLQRRSVLEKQIDQLRVTKSVQLPGAGRLISSADVPQRSLVDLASPLLLGGLLGLLLGLAAVAAREAVAGTVTEADDIAATGLRPRAVGVLPVPVAQRAVGRFRDRLRPAETAQYRMLAAALWPPHVRQAAGVTLLAPADDARDNCAMLAARLAAPLEAMGRTVLVLDADPLGGTVRRAFDVEGSPGIAEVLRGEQSVDAVLRAQAGRRVQVLPAGDGLDLAGLSGPRFADLLSSSAARADVVLVVGAPLSDAAEAYVVAPLVNRVLVVVRRGTTRRSALHLLQERIDEQLGAGPALRSPDVLICGASRWRRRRGGGRTVSGAVAGPAIPNEGVASPVMAPVRGPERAGVQPAGSAAAVGGSSRVVISQITDELPAAQAPGAGSFAADRP